MSHATLLTTIPPKESASDLANAVVKSDAFKNAGVGGNTGGTSVGAPSCGSSNISFYVATFNSNSLDSDVKLQCDDKVNDGLIVGNVVLTRHMRQ